MLTPIDTAVYAYTGNDPLNRIDPLGLNWLVSIGACATVAFLSPGVGASGSLALSIPDNPFHLGRRDHGPENIAMLRRLALNLAKLEGSKGSMKGKLKRAGWDDTFLTRLLAAFGTAHMR